MRMTGASVSTPRDRQGTTVSGGTHVAAFTDPEAYAFEAIKLAAGANVLGFGSAVGKTFHASLTRVSLDRLSIGLRTASASVTLNSGAPKAHVFMFATDPSAARRISGWTVSHQHIFHPRPDDLCCAIPPRQPGSAAVVTVPFDLLAAHGGDVTGLDPEVPTHDDRLFLAPELPRMRLISLMNDVERLAREEPWIVQMPAPAKALADTIMEALLACLTAGKPSRDRTAPGRHRQIVTSLARALRERPEDMLSLSDLCAEVGVAQRTLNLACEEFLGQSAMRFARGRRLDHIRQCLLVSDPTATTVTEVAMRYGFWELGRFAQAYRLRFGEPPSTTLRRNATLAELRHASHPVHARIA
jgi:AraC-like DNA-binding protein